MNRPLKFEQPIYVTRPTLPDRRKFSAKLEEVWDSQWITNNGPQHAQLETALKSYLNVENISLFGNGTLALLLGCQALRLSGEVITTPFTYAATPHVLYWNNITPVFCDIEEDTFNINPNCIEALISPKTTAIMPVHVFGYPVQIQEIEEIAKRHGLKVIYDAAHCFGVEVEGQPIGNFGDISMFSFHATKVYNTIEGGALTYRDEALTERLALATNLGFQGEERILVPGINAKMNELQAAMGLLGLGIIEDELERRRQLTMAYRERLAPLPGIGVRLDVPGIKHNYYNFVITIDEVEFGMNRDDLYDSLKEFNIFTRKYFYPLCSQFQCYRNLPSAQAHALPVAERLAKEVLSLPMYGKLETPEVHRICDTIEYLHEQQKPKQVEYIHSAEVEMLEHAVEIAN